MGAGLVGHHVGADAAANHLGHDLGRVAEEADRDRLPRAPRVLDDAERRVQVVGLVVEVFGAQARLDTAGLAFDGEHGGAGHGRGKGLRPAHAAQPGREDPFAREVATEMLAPDFDEGLVSALDDALAADIDPRAGHHLAEHHQAQAVELVEMLPIGPVGHDVRVGDQHPGRIGMGAEYAHRLARLHQEGVVVVEGLERRDDAVVVAPGARRPADAAIDDQLLRLLRHLGVEVVS